jgi:16S rRNA (guanine527-N7)-methyltransferase
LLFQDDVAELERLLEIAGVDSPIRARIARFGARVLEANARFNLTGAKTAAALAPHLADSLTLLPFVTQSLVDVGSGGGLPAIPIAIATGANVTLVETTIKKARFLEAALREFELAGTVVAERAEVAAHDPQLRERFTSGTARAVSLAPTVAELLLPFVAPGGSAALQRGTFDARERNALADAAVMLGARVESETELDGARRIVVVRKESPTPARFPRRPGIPEKRPLCW